MDDGKIIRAELADTRHNILFAATTGLGSSITATVLGQSTVRLNNVRDFIAGLAAADRYNDGRRIRPLLTNFASDWLHMPDDRRRTICLIK